MDNILTILLAGGAGERLSPLTQHTAKPAVSFGGSYRIIDFTLSNCINSDLRRIFVLTQYKSLELSRHIREGWGIFSAELNEFVEVVPPMKRIHQDWYLGTADAVYQNLESIQAQAPDLTLIVAGDHVYKMDYRTIIAWHRQRKAEATIATTQVAPEEAGRFGIAKISAGYEVQGFEEKPQHGRATRSVFNPEAVSASMGIYVFDTAVLLRALVDDAGDELSSHDFGRDILPKAISRHRVCAYDFQDLNDKKARYWRDVGTLDAYFEANMDLVAVTPELNLYDRRWPIRTRLVQQPPAKFVFAHEGRRMGVALDSIVSAGCIISGARVTNSLLSPGVRIDSYCEIEQSILMEGVQVGQGSRIHRAILAPCVIIPEGSQVGIDHDADRARGYTVTDSGIVVVPESDRSRPK